MMTAIKKAALAAFFCCILGCNLSPEPPASEVSAIKNAVKLTERLSHFTQKVLPAIEQDIQTGDLVTRLGTDYTSHMLVQLNQTDLSFSHCGIVSKEQDTLFVYHALGGEWNPTQKMRREPLFSFAHPGENKAIGIFRPQLQQQQRSKLMEQVHQAYAAGLPFDMAFDYSTDAEQYCAEFVAKCFATALQDTAWMSFSQRGNFRYVSVDNLFLNPLMKEIARFQY